MEILYGRVVEIPTELLSISGVEDLAQLRVGQISLPDVGHRYLLARYVRWASVAGRRLGVALEIRRPDAIGAVGNRAMTGVSRKFTLILGEGSARVVNAEVRARNRRGGSSAEGETAR